MTIKVTYKSKGEPGRRYVKKCIYGTYRYCIQSAKDKRFDVEQGTCDAEDLPPEILVECENHKGAFYACEWPL